LTLPNLYGIVALSKPLKGRKRTVMKCPICKTELVEWKMLKLETLDEHVSGSNVSLKMSYRCPSSDCPSFVELKPIAFWNHIGEVYSNDYNRLKALTFIDNNNAPFGTWHRKANVEINKKDENKLLFTFPCYPLKGWKVYSKWYYTSNEDGDILKRKLTFQIITSRGILYISGIRMLKFSLSRTYRTYKMAKTAKNNKCYVNELQTKTRKNPNKHDEWWRKVNAFAAKMALKNLGIKEIPCQSYEW